jgi:hypothetical protein
MIRCTFVARVFVRMVLFRECSVCLLDVGLLGLSLHPKKYIKVIRCPWIACDAFDEERNAA